MQVCAAAFNRGQFELLPGFDVTDQLARIEVPTLCVGGTEDWFTPPEYGPRRLADGIPNARLHVLEQCGHFPFLDRPEAFGRAVRSWLTDRTKAPVASNQ
jgi:3-oxoadipate enol-lactonase